MRCSERPSCFFFKVFGFIKVSVFAARHYLLRMSVPPPCRFDVVLVQDSVQWLKAAFDAQ